MRGYDSTLPQRNESIAHAATLVELLDVEAGFGKSRNAEKTMLKLLRVAESGYFRSNNTLGARIFLDLANISSRLKRYALAMKYYRQATRLQSKRIQPADPDDQSAPDSSGYTALLKDDAAEKACVSSLRSPASPVVAAQEISHSFDDGRKAAFYAVIIHVKQPIRSRRKAFAGISNVGHTFITLIKFNTDHSTVSRSFGFYPAKRHFLSATPIHPGDRPVFKDDALHPWDEAVGKFITEKKFNRILDNLGKFSSTRYNLNKNNCTDFGLSEAAIAGFDIRETAGRWPLGRGNNPANAGQSLMEKKFDNNDSDSPDTFAVTEAQGLSESNP